MMSDSYERKATIIHEAGHAVVAAHLGLPFQYVTAVPTPGFCKGSILYGGTDELVSGDLVEMLAVSLLGARVAVEKFTGLGPHLFAGAGSFYEIGYSQDEQGLKDLASLCDFEPPVTFEMWRSYMLREAVRIVSLAHVWQAVIQVSEELGGAAKDGQDVTGQRVKAILEGCEAKAGLIGTKYWD
jgi:hypothetical protein